MNMSIMLKYKKKLNFFRYRANKCEAEPPSLLFEPKWARSRLPLGPGQVSLESRFFVDESQFTVLDHKLVVHEQNEVTLLHLWLLL